MCSPGLLAAGGAMSTVGQVASVAGTVLGIGGQLAAGRDLAKTEEENARRIERQKMIEGKLTAIQDERTRQQFREEIARQDAELAARGVSLDSPTAVAFADAAGREMELASQSVRQTGSARAEELSNDARLARARGRKGLITGNISAASDFLNSVPDLWPGLAQRAVLS